MAMRDRRSTLLWALAWWFARRWVRRRAELAVAGVATGAAARRGKLGAVAAALAVVGALAAAFVVWRRLFARADEEVPAAPPPSSPPAAPATEAAGEGTA